MRSKGPIDLAKLVDQLNRVREEVLVVEEDHAKIIKGVHPNYQYNALNLLRYLKLRTHNLKKIQGKLTALGISSLSHAERHVLANLENILYLLTSLIDIPFEGRYPFGEHPVNFILSAKKLRRNTRRLFGNHVKKTGVMVTLSPEATDPAYIEKLLRSGMNIARINCAHDDLTTWTTFVQNIRDKEKDTGIACSIYADLSGPKLRIQDILTKEKRDKKGNVSVNIGDQILFGTDEMNLEEENDLIAIPSPTTIISDAKQGERILINDGKISCLVEEKHDEFLKCRIIKTSPKGGKLRKEKGLNMPDTHLKLPSLTNNDLKSLDFITSYADLVGYSFVRTTSDVELLQKELEKRGRPDMGIIIKIENKEAFENLPGLILQAMKSPSIGVMTARGDLAVELGAERLSEVQEEIMWICEAALIPNIWATQVLESLTKKGIPTRAEITDAAHSIRAECVMLNKGPYLDKSLKTLMNILNRMSKHQHKRLGTLRKLKIAKRFWKSPIIANAQVRPADHQYPGVLP